MYKNIFMEHNLHLISWKIYNFDPYIVGYCYKYNRATYN